MSTWAADDPVPRLEVEPLSEHEFESSLESFDGRSFGGETLAKAVMAGLRTGGERRLHSVHAYFLRAVPPERPIRFAVHVLRNGRRLSNRRVEVIFDGHKCAEVSLSLSVELSGSAFQDGRRPHDVPPPEQLPTFAAVMAEMGWPPHERPFDWRYIEQPWKAPRANEPPHWRAWIRPNRPLPEEPRFHDAALTYLSDFHSLGVIERRFGAAFEWDASTSLDHAFWIHRPLRWSDWILMESRADIAFAGRALTERLFYDVDGQRIASMAQESLFSVASVE